MDRNGKRTIGARPPSGDSADGSHRVKANQLSLSRVANRRTSPCTRVLFHIRRAHEVRPRAVFRCTASRAVVSQPASRDHILDKGSGARCHGCGNYALVAYVQMPVLQRE